eukprot:2575780-Rhodomonas_salina.2
MKATHEEKKDEACVRNHEHDDSHLRQSHHHPISTRTSRLTPSSTVAIIQDLAHTSTWIPRKSSRGGAFQCWIAVRYGVCGDKFRNQPLHYAAVLVRRYKITVPEDVQAYTTWDRNSYAL